MRLSFLYLATLHQKGLSIFHSIYVFEFVEGLDETVDMCFYVMALQLQ